MLSEKAKGKQRADTVPEGLPEHVVSTPRELMVRFTEGVQDLVLRLAEHDSVHNVKVKVRPARPILPGHMHTSFQLSGTHFRSAMRALSCNAAACASYTPGACSLTARSWRRGSARLRSASSAPPQKTKTAPTRR